MANIHFIHSVSWGDLGEFDRLA